MPPRRELPRPPNRIRAARLVNGDIQPLIGSYVEPKVLDQQELLELWALLSPMGCKAVLTAARDILHREGSPLRGAVVSALGTGVA